MKRKKFELMYGGFSIHADVNAMFNATEMAKPFGKDVNQWLRLPGTQQYIADICEYYDMEKSHIIKTVRGRGKNQGTWLHRKLVVRYAQWLDGKFAVWCDAQIELILFEGKNWLDAREQSKAGHKDMCAVIYEILKAQGVDPQFYHYIQEVKLVNFAVFGSFDNVNRDELDLEALKLIAKVETKNIGMLGARISYDDRKLILPEYARGLRIKRLEKMDKVKLLRDKDHGDK